MAGLMQVCKTCGWTLAFWKLALVSERPVAIRRNAAGRLHCDGGLAVEHSDGFGVYALNGIRMKAEYVTTPAEKIAPQTVLAETNADRRRELLRKVGVDRMLAVLPHKSLQKRGDYEMLSIRLSDEVTDARYLKMINPSVGCFHIEGVDPSCKTVEEALNWRNNNWHQNAEILT